MKSGVSTASLFDTTYRSVAPLSHLCLNSHLLTILSRFQNLECGFLHDTARQFECHHLLQLDRLKAEVDYMKQAILTQPNHVIVFAHNDLNHSNILILEDEDDAARFEMKFVDFDFSRYFYRGELLLLFW